MFSITADTFHSSSVSLQINEIKVLFRRKKMLATINTYTNVGFFAFPEENPRDLFIIHSWFLANDIARDKVISTSLSVLEKQLSLSVISKENLPLLFPFAEKEIKGDKDE